MDPDANVQQHEELIAIIAQSAPVTGTVALSTEQRHRIGDRLRELEEALRWWKACGNRPPKKGWPSWASY